MARPKPVPPYRRLAVLANRTADAELLLRVATAALQETKSIDILQASGQPLANNQLLAAAVKLARKRLADEAKAPEGPFAAAAALLGAEADDRDAARLLLEASLTRPPLSRGSTKVPSPILEMVPGLPAAMSR